MMLSESVPCGLQLTVRQRVHEWLRGCENTAAGELLSGLDSHSDDKEGHAGQFVLEVGREDDEEDWLFAFA